MGRPRSTKLPRKPQRQGRKSLPKAVREDIARRIRYVVASDFEGVPARMEDKLGALGKTAKGWLSPSNERAPGAWANVRSPDLPSLVLFAKATRRRIAWLLSGEEPEFLGEAMPRAELASAFARRAETALAEAMELPEGSWVEAEDASALLTHAIGLIVAEQSQRIKEAAPFRRISEVAGMLAAVATYRDDTASTGLYQAIRQRITDASSVRLPVQFLVHGPWERVPLSDRGEGAAFREWLKREGMSEKLDASDAIAAHYLALIDGTKNRPTPERRTGGLQRKRNAGQTKRK